MGTPKVITRGEETFDVLDYLVVDGIPSIQVSNSTSHSATNQPIFTIKEDDESCNCDDCGENGWTNKWEAFRPDYTQQIRI